MNFSKLRNYHKKWRTEAVQYNPQHFKHLAIIQPFKSNQIGLKVPMNGVESKFRRPKGQLVFDFWMPFDFNNYQVILESSSAAKSCPNYRGLTCMNFVSAFQSIQSQILSYVTHFFRSILYQFHPCPLRLEILAY